jgi:hypothetical protein
MALAIAGNASLLHEPQLVSAGDVAMLSTHAERRRRSRDLIGLFSHRPLTR